MEFLPRRFIRATAQAGRRDFFRRQFGQGQKIFSSGSARVICPPRRRDRRRVGLVETEARCLTLSKFASPQLPISSWSVGIAPGCFRRWASFHRSFLNLSALSLATRFDKCLSE